MLDEPPPQGHATWTGSLLAAALGDVPADQVWAILRRYGIQLQRRRSWCISTDPEFAPKAADIVGLYLDPPDNAVVICVDEKPSIQALERAQGYLRLPNGRARVEVIEDDVDLPVARAAGWWVWRIVFPTRPKKYYAELTN